MGYLYVFLQGKLDLSKGNKTYLSYRILPKGKYFRKGNVFRKSDQPDKNEH